MYSTLGYTYISLMTPYGTQYCVRNALDCSIGWEPNKMNAVPVREKADCGEDVSGPRFPSRDTQVPKWGACKLLIN